MVTNNTTESLNSSAKYFLRDPLVQMCQKVELQCFSLCQTIHLRHDHLCFWKWKFERVYRVGKRLWFFPLLNRLYSHCTVRKQRDAMGTYSSILQIVTFGRVTVKWRCSTVMLRQLERDTKVDFSLHCHRVSHTVTLQRESCIVRGWCGDVIAVTVLVRSERFPAPWR